MNDNDARALVAEADLNSYRVMAIRGGLDQSIELYDVVPQKARLRLSLNMPLEVLRDERQLAWDVSDKGHWGNGETEVGLDEGSDFTYVMGLVRQAFEYQMGGE